MGSHNFDSEHKTPKDPSVLNYSRHIFRENRMASLPKSVISTIKATAPMVGPHATKITSCFYQKLFRKDPDNLRYFNKTNQLKGFQQQALADSVVAYSLNIDNLGALDGAINQI